MKDGINSKLIDLGNQKEVSYCLVTYHPAFLLRSPENKKISWDDLKLFKKRIIDENL